jgi:predicted Zn finger-like uncharacterized protein
MSLATRCPACGTVFRLVRDQLKVSEGWVRCGRCSEVFNAGQRLFELEAELAAAAVPGSAPAAAASQDPPVPPVDAGMSPAVARVGPAPSRPGALSAPGRTAEDAAEDTGGEPAHVAKPAPAPVAEPEPAPAAETIELPQQAALATEARAEALAELEVQPAAEAATDAPAATPEFVLRADRAARRRHPAQRGTLAALALLLAALLTAQIALHYRDGLAAGWPVSRPWLQAACKPLGCSVEAPRRIDSLGVDSSGLVRLEGSPYYKFSLVIQNRAPVVVRMPAIELVLTDTQGQTMARRVLRAAELGNDTPSLPARGELALNATLELGEQRVAGYTVELFYP